jgi:hypothetical protein
MIGTKQSRTSLDLRQFSSYGLCPLGNYSGSTPFGVSTPIHIPTEVLLKKTSLPVPFSYRCPTLLSTLSTSMAISTATESHLLSPTYGLAWCFAHVTVGVSHPHGPVIYVYGILQYNNCIRVSHDWRRL